MSPILVDLYLLCMLFLLAFGGYVLRQNPHGRTNRLFAWLSLSLLGWLATLFSFSLLISPTPLLWVGRANFAAMAFVVPLTFLFTRAVAGRSIRRTRWYWVNAWLMALVSFTPWIDQLERISSVGTHVTTYGVLFPLYILHIVGYTSSALFTTFSPNAHQDRLRRTQVRTLGTGIFATAVIALITNLILPYFFGDFSFIFVGTISTILFLAAAGFAVFIDHLFNVRIVIRAAFIYGGLIALALEFYNIILSFLAKLLPLGNSSQRSFAATGLVLVVSAFTQQPLSRWLQRAIERIVHVSHRT